MISRRQSLKGLLAACVAVILPANSEAMPEPMPEPMSKPAPKPPLFKLEGILPSRWALDAGGSDHELHIRRLTLEPWAIAAGMKADEFRQFAIPPVRPGFRRKDLFVECNQSGTCLAVIARDIKTLNPIG